MNLKNVRNALCITAVSAAVALSAIPVSAPAMIVQAEEAQVTALDSILRQMYGLYQNRDFVSMYALDADNTTAACAEMIRNSGTDRYVTSLDGNTNAMMYVSPSGYYWYFGQMENNLRQGTGTTIALASDHYESFTGTYRMDFPEGDGTFSAHWFENNEGYDITGSFHGMQLNGTYKVNANWIFSGFLIDDSILTVTYTDSVITAICGQTDFDVEEVTDSGEGLAYRKTGTYYTVYASPEYADELFDGQGWFYVGYPYELSDVAAIGMIDGSGASWTKPDLSDAFSEVFYGNAAAVPAPALTVPEMPAPEVSTPAVPEVTAPAVPETSASEVTTPAPEIPAETSAIPAQPSISDTYVVQRGDNLSKIAGKVYGDRKQWRKIYDANKDRIRKDYTIFANQTLVIPAQ